MGNNVGWALPTEMPPIIIEKAGNARPTNLWRIVFLVFIFELSLMARFPCQSQA